MHKYDLARYIVTLTEPHEWPFRLHALAVSFLHAREEAQVCEMRRRVPGCLFPQPPG
jgi:hypothetical protein